MSLLTDTPTTPEATPPGGTPEVKVETPEVKVEVAPEVKVETPPSGAPEAYAEFTVAEGKTLDAAVAADIKTAAKELNLTQEAAQKLYDREVSTATKAVEAHNKTQTDTITALHTEWIESVKSDKEIGGDKLAENLAAANAAMKATCTDKMQVLLDKSGLGNHPEVIRHFLKIAPQFAEGKHVPGGKAPAGDSKSAARVLYPNNA